MTAELLDRFHEIRHFGFLWYDYISNIKKIVLLGAIFIERAYYTAG